MKAKQFVLSVPFLLCLLAIPLQAATNDVGTLLQKGLFEEEANRNLDTAIQAYQAVITQTEKDHQFEATAIFRLAECYRKQSKTNEAMIQYQRIVREFSDQAELVKLSREYAGDVSTASPAAVANTKGGTAAAGPASAGNEEEQRVKEGLEIRRIQEMLKDNPDLINVPEAGSGGKTLLMNAVKYRQLKVAAFLLDHNADPEVHDQSLGMTALLLAVDEGNSEMINLLLARGADVNATLYQGYSTLAGRTLGDTPLHLAALHGYKAIAEVLIAHGAKLNIQNTKGKTPLHIAAEKGFRAFAETLLAHGANLELKDSMGWSPLFSAVEAGNKAIVELLISSNANVNSATQDGATPLWIAAANGSKPLVELLLAHHADVNRADNGGATPLWKAAQLGNTAMVGLLVANHADVNATNKNGMTPLMVSQYSPASSRMEIARLLLDHGAEANLRMAENSDSPGYSALHLAICFSQVDLLELLLGHHADPNATVDKAIVLRVGSYETPGFTPLLLAIRAGSPETPGMVSALLNHKANPNLPDKKGATPLHWLMIINTPGKEREALAELLVSHGANVNARDESGQSPLHWAVRDNNMEMTEFLLSHHADVNLKDNKDNTPLDLVMPPKRTAPNFRVGVPDTYLGTSDKSMADLLREHGGVKELETGSIRYTRSSMTEPVVVLHRGTPLQDGCTLFELLATIYGPRSGGLPYPDFSSLKIHRREAGGRTNIIAVDLAGALKSGDCSKDVPLRWGDVVEIPEMDHNINENWGGLDPSIADTLTHCLARKVSIIVKGNTTQAELTPAIVSNVRSAPRGPNGRTLFNPMPLSVGGTSLPTAITVDVHTVRVNSLWFPDVVKTANVILSSSDLTRVKVTRIDPVTHKTEQGVFNLEKDTPAQQLLSHEDTSVHRLLLHDGDVIEIPEK